MEKNQRLILKQKMIELSKIQLPLAVSKILGYHNSNAENEDPIYISTKGKLPVDTLLNQIHWLVFPGENESKHCETS